MAGSTLPRRALGRILRDLRDGSGKSQLAAGLCIEVSKQTIGRVEDGKTARISTAQYRDLLDFYGASDEVREEFFGLLQEVKATKDDRTTSWWRAYADVVNVQFDHFMSLEQACDRMTTYQMTLVPGLLQTNGYRRWIITNTEPPKSAVDVERQLELLERRQRRLTESPDFKLIVLLSESALRHRIGTAEVMRDQLGHIIEMSQLPGVTVQVVPFAAEPHPGLLTQSFTLFEFPALGSRQDTEPPVIFVEGFTGSLFVEDATVISRHHAAVETIQQKALNADETRQLVTQIEEEYAS